jgi:hypothetical protein
MANQQDKSVLLYSGVSTQVIAVREGTATQTYEIGDLLKFETEGRVIIGTNSLYAGIALNNAEGSAATVDSQDLELIDFNALYLICAVGSTAQTDIGAIFAITYTVGAHTVSEAAGEVLAVGIYPGDVGVSGGRYIFRFNYGDFSAIGD